jgi:hypothetical protein
MNSKKMATRSYSAIFSLALCGLVACTSLHVRVSAAESPAGIQQEQPRPSDAPAIKNSDFEAGVLGKLPEQWTVPALAGFEAALSNEHPKAGNKCAVIVRVGESKVPFGNLIQRVDATPFRGKRVRFRAAVRADVDAGRNQAQLWFRVDRMTADGQRAMGAFDNMGNRPIKDPKWNYYDIVGDVADDAERVTVGMMLLGEGKAWIDDASLVVVGADVPVTAKSPQGVGLSGKPLEQIKPGLFEITGAMQILRTQGTASEIVGSLIGKRASVAGQCVLIPLPLAYRDQVPIGYQLSVAPSSAIRAIDIYKDGPNNCVLKAELSEAIDWDHIEITFKSLVMVGPTDFGSVPKKAAIPASWPEDAEQWLASTWCADSEHERIKALGDEIRGTTTDVPEIIHLVQEKAAKAFASAQGRGTSLTAVEALDKQGSCTSCANLVAALLRASGVPARIVAGYPSWSGPLQTHYIVEAYIPDFGWYPIESTLGQAPWPNTHQVNVAIILPAHERQVKAGARCGIAPGVPYLSLTELPDNKAALISVGTIVGAPSCDHECRMLQPLQGTPDEWQAATMAATSRWTTWINSELALSAEGKMTFGRRLNGATANSISQLMRVIGEE